MISDLTPNMQEASWLNALSLLVEHEALSDH